MGHERRSASSPLTEALQDQPYKFDFFEAVRQLERMACDSPRVGASHRPQEDVVRFSQDVSLGFAPAAVRAFRDAAEGKPASMSVSFLGLLGTNGPMPLSLTEYVYDRVHNHGDKTLAAFLDIFNHRMISLFYRAWARNQLCVSYDRDGDDWFAAYVASLFGMGTEAFRDRDAVPDKAKRYYAGHLCWQGRNAEGLRAILQDDLEAPVAIQEFVGHWVDLPEHQRCRLGGAIGNAELGATSVVGSRFWECQQRFRIRLGPVGFDRYQRLLPEGESLARLTAWVRSYAGDEVSWELQLVLSRTAVPKTCLGRAGRLGWTTWLGTGPPERDPDDLVLQSPALQ